MAAPTFKLRKMKNEDDSYRVLCTGGHVFNFFEVVLNNDRVVAEIHPTQVKGYLWSAVWRIPFMAHERMAYRDVKGGVLMPPAPFLEIVKKDVIECLTQIGELEVER